MPCIPLGGGGYACSRASRERCKCGNIATKLCDFPLTGPKAGKTCDTKLCEKCATQIGKVDARIGSEDGAMLAGLAGTARRRRATGRTEEAAEAKRLHADLLAAVSEPETVDYCPAHALATEAVRAERLAPR